MKYHLENEDKFENEDCIVLVLVYFVSFCCFCFKIFCLSVLEYIYLLWSTEVGMFLFERFYLIGLFWPFSWVNIFKIKFLH